jgi:hypothetical protein
MAIDGFVIMALDGTLCSSAVVISSIYPIDLLPVMTISWLGFSCFYYSKMLHVVCGA